MPDISNLVYNFQIDLDSFIQTLVALRKMWKVILACYFAISCVTCTSEESFLEERDWWQTATFYQIYPKSFKDTDGDGIGDLPGVIEKLDYIKDLGVTGIWLSPIFKSPQLDNGYDISDYRDIDPMFGTLEIFEKLVKEAHKRGLRVILDYVPNHTSSEHEWFKRSENGEKPYDDYYIWKDGKDGSKTEPPNNWRSCFGHSAWAWSDKREKFFLHRFLLQQVDLDYRNPLVRQEMKDILTFWLDTYEVDGVRMDAIATIMEDERFPDEPRSYAPDVPDFDYGYLSHIYSENVPENYDLIYDFRTHFDYLSNKTGRTKIFMAEDSAAYNVTIPYFGTPDGSKLGAHFPFNFFLLQLNHTSNAEYIADIIEGWLTKLPQIYTHNWVIGNHDNHRIATKVGTEKVDTLNMLTAFLPGIQVTYNGEEIGMEDGNVTCEQGNDHIDNCTLYPSVSRDNERTPFHWDSSEFAGFTDGSSTWLPVSEKKDNCNVADQLKDERSHLNIYKSLQKLRKHLSRRSEIVVDVQGEDKKVLNVARFSKLNHKYEDVIEYICNLGDSETSAHLWAKDTAVFEVVISSGNSKRLPGDIVENSQLLLDPYEALILREI